MGDFQVATFGNTRREKVKGFRGFDKLKRNYELQYATILTLLSTRSVSYDIFFFEISLFFSTKRTIESALY